MKRTFTLAILVFLLFSLPSGKAAAADKVPSKPIAHIHRAAKPVKADCDLSKYPGYAIRMDSGSCDVLKYFQWEGKDDLSADIYLLWDDENLFIAAKVTDDVPFDNSKEGPDIWDGDALEIMLGMDDKADPERMFFAKSDYQIGLSTGNGKDIDPGEWVWRRDDYQSGIEVVSKPWDKGYIIEARIPFAVLGGFKPETGKKFDFDIAVDDSDIHKRELQFAWTGSTNLYSDPSQWGVAVLEAPKSAFAVSFSSVIIVIAGIVIIGIFFAFAVRRPK